MLQKLRVNTRAKIHDNDMCAIRECETTYTYACEVKIRKMRERVCIANGDCPKTLGERPVHNVIMLMCTQETSFTY